MFYLLTIILTMMITWTVLAWVNDFLDYSPSDLLNEIAIFTAKIIILPFIPLWILVRNVVKPVPSYKLDKEVKEWDVKTHHFVKNIYLIHDTKTKIWYHKFFFVRVFQAEEPKPFPIGKYRIGEEN